jgi:hypothetical protein
MFIVLAILQVLLAAHTAIGAFWKFQNSANVVPSLDIIPFWGWMVICVFELAVAFALVLPLFKKSFEKYVSMAAWFIVIEMLLFCVAHVLTWSSNYGPVYYWLAVAVVAGFVAYKKAAPKIS